MGSVFYPRGKPEQTLKRKRLCQLRSGPSERSRRGMAVLLVDFGVGKVPPELLEEPVFRRCPKCAQYECNGLRFMAEIHKDVHKYGN
jgi:hypothetical protein